MAGSRKSRKAWYIAAAVAVIAVGGVAGFTTLSGAGSAVDPSRVVEAELGTMVRSVVATGKIEPMTKVDIKSKANGIIKALHSDVDRPVEEGDVLVELDKDWAARRTTSRPSKSACRLRTREKRSKRT